MESTSAEFAATKYERMAIVGGFVGGRFEKTSMLSYFVAANSADVDSIYDLITLRARSRDLVRNTPVATGAVSTMLTNVVGSGLSLMPQPDKELLKMSDDEAMEWTENVEREFECWASSPMCDVTLTQNFYGLQALFFRSILESGDCFALLPMADNPDPTLSSYALQIQIIEADRIQTPGAAGIVALVPVLGAGAGISSDVQSLNGATP